MNNSLTTQFLNRETIGPVGRGRADHESVNVTGAKEKQNAKAPHFFLKNRWTIFRWVVKYSSITEQLLL
jgi:hypothetical protein